MSVTTNLPFTLTVGRLPLNFSETPRNFYRSVVRRMRGFVDEKQIIIGYTSTSPAPAYNLGPWFSQNAGTWRFWDDAVGRYANTNKRLLDSGSGHTVTLASNPLTATRTATVIHADAAATVALLYYLYVPRDTIFPTGSGTVVINGTNSNNFYAKLSGNVSGMTLTMVASQKITITFANIGTAYTVTWPAAVKWTGGTAPTQPVSNGSGNTGTSAVGIYILRKINSVIYGDFVNFGPGKPSQSVTLPPVGKNYGGSGGSAKPGTIKQLP